MHQSVVSPITKGDFLSPLFMTSFTDQKYNRTGGMTESGCSLRHEFFVGSANSKASEWLKGISV